LGAQLSRSITVRGSDSDEASQFRSLHVGEAGAQIIVTSFVDSSPSAVEEVGEAHIIGVQVREAGMGGYDDRPAVGFHGQGVVPAGRSLMRSCAVFNVFNVGIRVAGSSGVEISRNVVYNTLGSSVLIASPGNVLRNNLALTAVTTLTYRGRETRSALINIRWSQHIANFHFSGHALTGDNTVVTGNAAAGSARMGIKFDAGVVIDVVMQSGQVDLACDGSNGAVFRCNCEATTKPEFEALSRPLFDTSVMQRQHGPQRNGARPGSSLCRRNRMR
jgi:parallel beta-helix repeat protein